MISRTLYIKVKKATSTSSWLRKYWGFHRSTVFKLTDLLITAILSFQKKNDWKMHIVFIYLLLDPSRVPLLVTWYICVLIDWWKYINTLYLMSVVYIRVHSLLWTFSMGFNKYKMLLWRRQQHPTPVLLPGKFHGRRSRVGCSPWGR